MDTNAANRPLSRGQRLALVGLVIVAGLLGSYAVMRSALMSRRMGDYGVFARTGWAIRSGQDIYSVTDDNGFHYCYPPLFAILMTPLADPPTGTSRPGVLPFALSVFIWYLLNLFFLTVAVHLLARALEERATDPQLRSRPGSRRWWALRAIPVLACAVPIGHTLVRGQVNLLLLLCLCGLASCTLRRQPRRAGLWLAGAIVLKVIPAFLLLYPLWRRDRRCLAGCSIGLFLGGLVIPASVLGIGRTIDYYREFTTVMIAPGLGLGNDQSRARELIEATATDSQSLQVMIHNTLHVDRGARPAVVSAGVRWSARLIGCLLTLITLLAAGWRANRSAVADALLLGGLIIVMLLLSPVCHLHYFSLAVPLVMGLVMAAWQRRPDHRVGIGLVSLLALNVLASVMPNLPHQTLARDLGLVTYLALALWAAGVVALWRLCRSQPAAVCGSVNLPDLAA